jgi:hypothetical protein
MACQNWEALSRRPKGDPMAITIFLVLNGLAVVFLLYVLANFWLDGHRAGNRRPTEERMSGVEEWGNVAVITHPISPAAQGGLSVIPFRVAGKIGDQPAGGTSAKRKTDRAAKRISTR